MSKQARQTGTSKTVKAVSVADYIVERLAAEGIDHCFGVAGDYAFPICNAVDSSAKVKWIGCSNELNASYAADGYARVPYSIMGLLEHKRDLPNRTALSDSSSCGLSHNAALFDFQTLQTPSLRGVSRFAAGTSNRR